MIKILIVLGTRPEIIKLIPVIKELKKYPKQFRISLCVSGQHDQLLRPFLNIFEIKPDYDLRIMKEDQKLKEIFWAVFKKTGEIIKKTKPDWLLVQGDTTTALAAAWAAFLAKVKIAHVEAGLRTGDLSNPFPEEANRKIMDHLSDILFAPTKIAFNNLIKEGIPRRKILLTGNTIIDTLKMFENKPWKAKIKERIILLTVHRRESFGPKIENIFEAIRQIAQKHPDIRIIFPVHLNPNVKKPAEKILKNIPNISLIKPLAYMPLLDLLKKSYLVLTDSGGLIEEASYFAKPVIILREKTERQESVIKGVAELAGAEKKNIIRKVTKIISNPQQYKKMSKKFNLYGAGDAAQIITKYFLKLHHEKKNSHL